jgi:hypothetical protein
VIDEVSAARPGPPTGECALSVVAHYDQIGTYLACVRADLLGRITHDQLGCGLEPHLPEPGDTFIQYGEIGFLLLSHSPATCSLGNSRPWNLGNDREEEDFRMKTLGQERPFPERGSAFHRTVVSQENPRVHAKPNATLTEHRKESAAQSRG